MDFKFKRIENMTREEKIKEAYGDYWFPDNIDEDGWTDSISQGFLNSIPCDHKEMHIVFGHQETWYRPISIRDIDNNNGWIKIESESDLPKITMGNKDYKYWIFHSDGLISDLPLSWIFTFKQMEKQGKTNNTITHYQPIQKPKPPIY